MFPKIERVSLIAGLLLVVSCGGGGGSAEPTASNDTPASTDNDPVLSPPVNFGFPGQTTAAEFQTTSSQTLSGPGTVNQGDQVDTTIVVDTEAAAISFLIADSAGAPEIVLNFTEDDFVGTTFGNRSYANLANSSTNLALLRRPVESGLEYTSFGAWSTSQTDSTATILLGGSAFGQVTDVAAMPSTGSASYRGTIVAFFDSPDTGLVEVGGNFDLGASFAIRQFDGRISGVSRQFENEVVGWGDFEISDGTIDGREISANIAGNDLTGAMMGGFFGPIAEEVGFSFSLSDEDALQKLAGAGAGAISE